MLTALSREKQGIWEDLAVSCDSFVVFDYLLYYYSQALIVQGGPLASLFMGFLITHTDTR
jgi:hypothetical protein